MSITQVKEEVSWFKVFDLKGKQIAIKNKLPNERLSGHSIK